MIKYKKRFLINKKIIFLKSLLKLKNKIISKIEKQNYLKKTTLNFKRKFKINKLFIKNKIIFFFFKKVFSILIKLGSKVKIYKFYFNWLNIVKFRTKKKIFKKAYIIQFMRRILPKSSKTFKFLRGKPHGIASLKKSKNRQLNKMLTIASIWIKKSFVSRKEKTFILKFYSEIEDTRYNRSSSIKLKKEYYKEFCKNINLARKR